MKLKNNRFTSTKIIVTHMQKVCVFELMIIKIIKKILIKILVQDLGLAKGEKIMKS